MCIDERNLKEPNSRKNNCQNAEKQVCFRDLRVFADALNGKVYHFRDKTGLECDAVVHLRNGSYGLIEVKLGGDKLIEEKEQTILRH